MQASCTPLTLPPKCTPISVSNNYNDNNTPNRKRKLNNRDDLDLQNIKQIKMEI